MSLCYLNGDFVPLADAKISVLDRGFIFGDGVYEVIPVFGRRPFRLRAHVGRLARSLEETGISVRLSGPAWEDLLRDLVAHHDGEDLSVYVQVTRGVAPRNHAAPADVEPTVFAMVSPLAAATDAQTVRAIALVDQRWQRCDIKAISLLPNVLARTAAVAAGAYEAVLFRDGWLTEGAASNVFVVSGGRIRTPPHSGFILPGITRDTLVEALSGSPDAVLETTVSREEVLHADEVWLTSSTRDLVPVSHLDGQRIGRGEPGPVYARVLARYAQFKAADLAAVPPVPRPVAA